MPAPHHSHADKPQVSHSPVRSSSSFGRRREPATITITRNGTTRHFRISPVLFSLAFSIVAMFMVGYLGATAYLVFRDDLIGASHARNARLMHEYEDRIAALRSNLDRVTSRQLLDQQVIESKIAELVQRQEMLTGRDGRIGKLMDAAQKRGLEKFMPEQAADEKSTETGTSPLHTGSIEPSSASDKPEFAARPLFADAGGLLLRGSATPIRDKDGETGSGERPELVIAANDRAFGPGSEAVFSDVKDRIRLIEEQQMSAIGTLRNAAVKKAAAIASVMEKLKVKIPSEVQQQVGGPFIPLEPGTSFEDHVEALDTSLKALDVLSGKLSVLPIGNPAPGKDISSPFGSRVDPFFGRAAMHSGTDFRAPTGTPARATADGTVIDAGRNGGYGNMVEIDHGGGLTTRYAHLSAIKVKTGQKVKRGEVVGLVGSTGRSTGPHLHYEVRKGGQAIDPARFLLAGRQIKSML
ncbi:MAG: M23 family metallopeptidase [Nitratireductor sp.]|nr:M23 family metallopeptidase [Nitratireductor sp.]MCB1455449.1 M23 family metallopeptidase [Nitratireductor sp.]MCB1460082.1 M23 family metallopeptidase [Nitratireductor sp.]